MSFTVHLRPVFRTAFTSGRSHHANGTHDGSEPDVDIRAPSLLRLRVSGTQVLGKPVPNAKEGEGSHCRPKSCRWFPRRQSALSHSLDDQTREGSPRSSIQVRFVADSNGAWKRHPRLRGVEPRADVQVSPTIHQGEMSRCPPPFRRWDACEGVRRTKRSPRWHAGRPRSGAVVPNVRPSTCSYSVRPFSMAR